MSIFKDRLVAAPSQQSVTVGGTAYRVTEHAGILKAHLNGIFGWTTVWADTIQNLERRIKLARQGGQ